MVNLKSWVVEQVGVSHLIGTIDLPHPHDLAAALEFGGARLKDSLDRCHGIELRWTDVPYFLNLCPGAGCWEIWYSYTEPKGPPVAFLYYKDDCQFGASGAHAMYHPHEPVWDRGWLHMLEAAEVVE